MKVMFIDESGDHNLLQDKVDPSYPVFVLAGCVFEEEYYTNTFVPTFNQFKTDHFGSDNIYLHTLEMVRPRKSNDRRFDSFRDADFRNKFYTDLNQLIQQTNFKIVACVIKKIDHSNRYGVQALDPYLLSFDNLLNRLIFELKGNRQGKIFAEKRGDILDNQLELAWLNTKISGTKIVKPSEVKEKVQNLTLIDKKQNEAGLQLADIIASPIGREIIGKSPRIGHEVTYETVKGKFRTVNGKIEGCGLTILP